MNLVERRTDMLKREKTGKVEIEKLEKEILELNGEMREERMKAYRKLVSSSADRLVYFVRTQHEGSKSSNEALSGRAYDLSVSGVQFVMRYKIIHRLEKAGATSEEKAVTSEEAGFDLQEQQWLRYFAGGLLSEIRKTKDKRYYIQKRGAIHDKQTLFYDMNVHKE